MFTIMLGFAVCAFPAQAALVLEIDAAAETYCLTGSTSLDAFLGDDSDFALWSMIDGVTAGALTPFDNTLATSSPNALPLTRLGLYDNATTLILDWGVSSTPTQTVTGNGIEYSYASASTTQKDRLESFVGQSLQPIAGLLADPVAVVAVPEPSSLVLLGLGGLMIGFRRRGQTLG